jgi:hypothetical protein
LYRARRAVAMSPMRKTCLPWAQTSAHAGGDRLDIFSAPCAIGLGSHTRFPHRLGTSWRRSGAGSSVYSNCRGRSSNSDPENGMLVAGDQGANSTLAPRGPRDGRVNRTRPQHQGCHSQRLPHTVHGAAECIVAACTPGVGSSWAHSTTYAQALSKFSL